MVVDVLISIFIIITGFFAILLPHISIWPPEFLSGITYLLSTISIVNFIIPVDAIFYGGNVFINFLIYYYGARLLSSIFGYFRGSSNIKI